MSNDNLQQMLNAQEDLQIAAYDGSPAHLLAEGKTDEAVEFIKWNVLALTDELHELLAETSWKPWAKSSHLNVVAAQSELIDALHFLMNIALVLNLDADAIVTKYFAKRNKNIARQEAGYDGIKDKCPACGRALDDDGVFCFLKADGAGWCANSKVAITSIVFELPDGLHPEDENDL